MALRCERCRTADLTLESFGVYRCPNCGRVDADGNVLGDGGATAERADATQPTILETGRASFVAPPPPSPMVSAVSSLPATTGREMPGLFLATVGVLGLIDVVEAVQSRSPISLILQGSTMIALLTGKKWARTLAMGGAVLLIGLAAMAFVATHGAAPYGLLCAVTIVLNGWWLYVLLRPDTVAYFSR